jgi:hypothetical protein|nr:MAG TPA: DNA (cytosine-5)-methyltransferase 3A [Caudoviricetes sp.]
MKVLVACEESQTVCTAFRERGHEAYSCDIQEPSGGHPEWHILGDALEAIEGQVTTMDGRTHDVGRWDLLIAHPPCTYLSNAGANRLRINGEIQEGRMQKAKAAKALFMAMLNADIPRIAVENPVPGSVHGLPPLLPDYPTVYVRRGLVQKDVPMAQKPALADGDGLRGADWKMGRRHTAWTGSSTGRMGKQRAAKSKGTLQNIHRNCQSYGRTMGMIIFVASRKCYGGKHEDSKSISNENIYVAH